jgi:hypothetical protein
MNAAAAVEPDTSFQLAFPTGVSHWRFPLALTGGDQLSSVGLEPPLDNRVGFCVPSLKAMVLNMED